jgi:hypothetical protein
VNRLRAAEEKEMMFVFQPTSRPQKKVIKPALLFPCVKVKMVVKLCVFL